MVYEELSKWFINGYPNSLSAAIQMDYKLFSKQIINIYSSGL